MSTYGREEPTSDARLAARAIRSMFVALVAEGFSEREALLIVGQMLASQAGGEKP